MALPTSRNTTYAPSSQIKSNDLNDIQDNIIGNKHGQLEIGVDAFEARGDTGAVGTYNPLGYVSAFTGAGNVRIPIRVPVGKRIVTVTVFYSINGTAATLTPNVKRQVLSTAAINSVAAGVGDNTGGAGVIESQAISCNHVVLAGNSYFAEVTVANANHRIYGMSVFYDAL